MYAKSYFEMRKKTANQREISYSHEHKRITERIKGKLVLDYGCGEGQFLEKFIDWKKYGVEVSEHCISVCESKGIFMVNPDILMDEAFDLVIFRGVLQHIDEPFTALRTAARVLRPGGLLAILAQPDADSLCYRLFGELPALDPPRNWWIPGHREVLSILNNLGFENAEVLHPYWGGPYANPRKDFLSFAVRLLGIKSRFAFPGNMMEIYARKVES